MKSRRQKLFAVGDKAVPAGLALLRGKAGRDQNCLGTSGAGQGVLQIFACVEWILVKPRASAALSWHLIEKPVLARRNILQKINDRMAGALVRTWPRMAKRRAVADG